MTIDQEMTIDRMTIDQSTEIGGRRISIDRSMVLRSMQRSGEAQGANGWTLVELLIVITLIMILASLALTQYRNSITSTREAALKSDLFLMRDAIDQYYADKGKYPESLQTLVSESYLRTIPKDPFTQSSDTWQTEMADPEPGSTSAATGIYDVKSGHDGTALDGSRYADW
jgi:general secretion pathway protein G